MNMNLVFNHFDFTFGITGILSFIITLFIIAVITFFITILYSNILLLSIKKTKTYILESLACVLACITSVLLCAFYSACEINVDEYTLLQTKLELYTENRNVQYALLASIADKRITNAELSRLNHAFDKAKRYNSRLALEKYESEIKDKIINP